MTSYVTKDQAEKGRALLDHINDRSKGWAATVDGVIWLRTASDTPTHVKVNALVLIFGYDAQFGFYASEREIEREWDRQMSLPPHRVAIVPVRAVEVKP